MSDDQDTPPAFGLRAAQKPVDGQAKKRATSAQPAAKPQTAGTRQRPPSGNNPAPNRRRPVGGKRKFPAQLTSYDLWKLLGCLFTICLMVGVIFYPGTETGEWLMTIGYLNYPIWMFLIGYSRSSRIKDSLLWGSITIIGVVMAVGGELFPANFLISILICRLLRDAVASRMYERSMEGTIWMVILLSAFAIPSFLLFELGTAGILLAMVGYAKRHEDDLYDRRLTMGFVTILSWLALCGMGYLAVEMDYFQLGVFGAASLTILMMLKGFKRRKYSKISSNIPKFILVPMQLFGRRTLIGYIAVFMGLYGFALYSKDPRFGTFQFKYYAGEPPVFEKPADAFKRMMKGRSVEDQLIDEEDLDW